MSCSATFDFVHIYIGSSVTARFVNDFLSCRHFEPPTTSECAFFDCYSLSIVQDGRKGCREQINFSCLSVFNRRRADDDERYKGKKKKKK